MKDLRAWPPFATMGTDGSPIVDRGRRRPRAVGRPRVGHRAVGSVNRDSVGDGRRRGERCTARPAFPLETHCPC